MISEKQLTKIRKDLKSAIDDTVAHLIEWGLDELDQQIVTVIGLTEPLIEHRDDISCKLNDFQEAKMDEGKPVNATEVMVRANPLFREMVMCSAQINIADKLIRTMQNRQYAMALRIKKKIDE
jgi:hypothetical protein